MEADAIIIDTMAGRPALGLKRKGFALYEKTWLILKELEFKSSKTDDKKKMIELAHDAIKQYADNNYGSKKEKGKGI